MNWTIILANVIVIIHVLYVGFVVVSVPLILLGWLLKWKWVRNCWYRIIHFLMMAIVVLEMVFGVTCPLTTWESDLRIAGGELSIAYNEDGTEKQNEYGQYVLKGSKEYEEDFIARLLYRILFVQPQDVPTHVLNILYYVFGGMVLATMILVPPRWPWKKAITSNLAQP